jgi:hypothetical protein
MDSLPTKPAIMLTVTHGRAGYCQTLLSSEVIETGLRLEPAFVYQRRLSALSDPHPTRSHSVV